MRRKKTQKPIPQPKPGDLLASRTREACYPSYIEHNRTHYVIYVATVAIDGGLEYWVVHPPDSSKLQTVEPSSEYTICDTRQTPRLVVR